MLCSCEMVKHTVVCCQSNIRLLALVLSLTCKSVEPAWLHSLWQRITHARKRTFFFFLLIYSYPHRQINNGIAGRRVSHCPSDLWFPAKRITQGGRNGGETGSLDEWMQTHKRRRWFVTMLREGREEGRKDGWTCVAENKFIDGVSVC